MNFISVFFAEICSEKSIIFFTRVYIFNIFSIFIFKIDILLLFPITVYISNFKKQVLRRIIVEHETVDRVFIDLGLKSRGMLHNWLREYRKNEYNIVNKQRVRLPMTKREQMIKPEKHRLKQENEFVKRLSVLVDYRIKNCKLLK